MTTLRPLRFSWLFACAWLVTGLLAATHFATAAESEERVDAEDTPPPPVTRIEDATAPKQKLEIEPSPLVDRMLGDELTTDAQRQRLRVFHGRWDDLDEALLPVDLRAELALLRGQWWADVFEDDRVSEMLRARAAVRRYDRSAALRLLDDPQAAADRGTLARLLHLRGLVHLRDGQQALAIESLSPLRELLRRVRLTDPAELTAAARGLALLARLEGTPAQDHHAAMSLLAKARELDPLHWPAMVAEADLLAAKGNREEAAQAFLQALSLNPRSAEAWFGLGRMSAMTFQFDAAGKRAKPASSGSIPNHPLAHRLRLITLIRQKDTDAATQLVQRLEAEPRFASHHDLHALFAAVDGLAYRRAEMRERLPRIDEQAAGEGAGLGPGPATPHFIVGEALSFARQYDVAEEMLRAAVEREPNWAEPRVALGLLLMQSGDLPGARKALRHAEPAGPVPRPRRESAQARRGARGRVRRRSRPSSSSSATGRGSTRCWRETWPPSSTRCTGEVADAFEHEPAVQDADRLLPDEQRFAVRITGLPDIWTIAAATGDVVALTPPRSGAKQHGSFDWPVVLRHEYVHTVTLSRTANRIPHWFTEACAVWQEPNPRSFARCRLLASAWHKSELFAARTRSTGASSARAAAGPFARLRAGRVDARVHPRSARPRRDDRAAGPSRRGRAQRASRREVTGQSVGCVLRPTSRPGPAGEVERGASGRAVLEGTAATRRIRGSRGAQQPIEALLAEHPKDPGVLQAGGGALPAARTTERAAACCGGTPGRAGGSLAARELLRLAEQRGGYGTRPRRRWRFSISGSSTTAGGRSRGSHASQRGSSTRRALAMRALQREPYNATYREFAATVALQRGTRRGAAPPLRHAAARTRPADPRAPP